MATVTAPPTQATTSRSILKVSKANQRPVWKEKPSLTFNVTKAVILALISTSIIIPLLVVVSTSIAGKEQIIRAGGFVLFPERPTLEAYRAIFSGNLMSQAIGVSLFVTVVGTVLATLCTLLLAYATSRPSVLGARKVNVMVLFTLLFAPGLIPMFLMIKQLNLIDSLWSLILPGLLSGFNFVVMRAFFMNLPQELLESARIDGASDFQILWRIVLPLSKAVVAVVSLFYAVGFWNSFFNALLYINDTAKWPVQVVLRTYVLQGRSLNADQLGITQLPPPQSIQMAVVVVALVPILMVYPFLQRHFTKGVITGAIKG